MPRPDTPPDLHVSRHHGILRLRLARPTARNAITPEMITAMLEELALAAPEHGVNVVALLADGPDFCAGIDLARASARTGPQDRRPRVTRHRHTDLGAHRLVQQLAQAVVPVAARIRGTAAGLGCALALIADIGIVSTTARFSVPYIRRGFTPDCGTTVLLPRLIGLARAREMLFHGRAVTAEEAVRWGLIARAYADPAVDAAFEEIVSRLAAAGDLGRTRAFVSDTVGQPLHNGLKRETLALDLSLRTADAREGVGAFLAKRKPEFEGR